LLVYAKSFICQVLIYPADSRREPFVEECWA
jgi:hypothetical protein